MGSGTSQSVLERVTQIVRRDLKLGTDVNVTPQMPFFNSDVDIDSLDILLLMTSIEKEFGIKIPSQDVGRRVFESVGTLASYVAERGQEQTATVETARSVEWGKLLERLPHREPFRFVSRILEVKAGESAEAVWAVRGDEAFFAGHFPGQPLVPGVLIAEALAQAAGLAVAAKADQAEDLAGKLAQVDVRFEATVRPPAEIVLRARLVRAMGALHQFEVEALTGAKSAARGTITLACQTRNDAR